MSNILKYILLVIIISSCRKNDDNIIQMDYFILGDTMLSEKLNYFDYIPDSLVYDSIYSLDINNDSSIDYIIHANLIFVSHFTHEFEFIIETLNGNKVITDSLLYAVPYNFGDAIWKNDNFNSGRINMYYENAYYYPFDTPVTYIHGLWPILEKKYIAIKSNSDKFGWIQIELDYRNNFTLCDYAIETKTKRET